LKTADGNENRSIESMKKYENQSKQKFGKNACDDLGNDGSIHLSYEGKPRGGNLNNANIYKVFETNINSITS
jgi:hypothetical protein